METRNEYLESCSAFVTEYMMNRLTKKLGIKNRITCQENTFSFHPFCPRYFLGKGTFTFTVNEGKATLTYTNSQPFALWVLRTYQNFFKNLDHAVFSGDYNAFNLTLTYTFNPSLNELKSLSRVILQDIERIEQILELMCQRQNDDHQHKELLFKLSAIENFMQHGSYDIASQFSSIYSLSLWDNAYGKGSGSGSRVDITAGYREFLQNFFKEHQIQSIADVGCGDRQFSQLLNLEGIQYTGYDVVDSVINKNRQEYAKDNVRFELYDGDFEKIAPADLLICKDVLQHLPNALIFNFLRILKKFKYALIANGVNIKDPSQNNHDIAKPGEFRPLSLRDAPFNLKAQKVYSIDLSLTHDDTHVIEVLLVTAESSQAC